MVQDPGGSLGKSESYKKVTLFFYAYICAGLHGSVKPIVKPRINVKT